MPIPFLDVIVNFKLPLYGIVFGKAETNLLTSTIFVPLLSITDSSDKATGELKTPLGLIFIVEHYRNIFFKGG